MTKRLDEPEPTVRSPQETATGLLEVELKFAALADFTSNEPSLPYVKNRLDTIQFLRSHVERCAERLVFADLDHDAIFRCFRALSTKVVARMR